MRRIDLGYTRHTQGDLAGAEDIYWSMIRDGEDPLAAANNLFVILSQARRSADLRRLYLSIEGELPANPDWAARFYDRLLGMGDFEAGWQWYEARRHLSASRAQAPVLSIPEWTGGPVERLLVWREQGLGDEIQFARYIAEASGRGAKVTLLCSPSLARLFSVLPAEVVPLSGRVRLGDFDAWCLLGSVPLRLGEPFTIPPPVAVSASPRRAGGIGVMMEGSPTHPNDQNRSMPADAAARLMQLPGAISLRPADTGARDFQDTAELVAGLDLVVTVDTSVAHLAGSMGKPVWVMLPAVKTDWRWRQLRTDSPWYPSARLFRQGDGGWDQVVTEVIAALDCEDARRGA
jgi:hypothetical protein